MKLLPFFFFIVLFPTSLKAQPIDRFPIYPGCDRYMQYNHKLNGCFQERMMKDLDFYVKSVQPKHDSIAPIQVKLSMIVDQNGKIKSIEVLESKNRKAANQLVHRVNQLQHYFEKHHKKIKPAMVGRRNVNFKMVFIGSQYL